MDTIQKFGGNWTVEKLNILTDYLDAYLTALKKQRFKKIYIDAFAGTGTITSRDESQVFAGSAKRALQSRQEFDHYYFIEANKKKEQQLESMIATEFADLKSKTTVYNGDANTVLIQILRNIDWRYNRALLFLDPCATEVNWTTLQEIANTHSIDVWYLFPFSALNRMLRKDGNLDETWENCITRLLGDSGWKQEFYEEDPQITLFDEVTLFKDASPEHIQEYIVERLKTIFPRVANNPRVLANAKGSPLFLFCFAISNPSPAAQRVALNIAEHILGKRRG